jgi:hypothetical protein
MAFLRPLAPCLVAIAGFLSGCFLASGAYESAGTGAAGGGGSGAATSATSGGDGGTGGSIGGTAGTGGMTNPPIPCGLATDCPVETSVCRMAECDKTGTCVVKPASEGMPCTDPPAPEDSCHVAECKEGVCQLKELSNGTLVDAAPLGDCKKYVCENGAVVPKADNGDKPTGSECTPGACENGEPVEQPGSEGMACGGNLGACCKGSCCYAVAGDTCNAGGCCPFGGACGSSACCKGFDHCCGEHCCAAGESCCGAGCCAFGETCCGGQCCGFLETCDGGQCVGP